MGLTFTKIEDDGTSLTLCELHHTRTHTHTLTFADAQENMINTYVKSLFRNGIKSNQTQTQTQVQAESKSLIAFLSVFCVS